ncbi:MAG: plastocyanin/azurin family copper-binding protein [Gemmatimonadota bacterium]
MLRLLLIVAPLVLTASVALAAPSATVLKISADPKGALRFDKATLRAKPGRVTITMSNPSVLPHNVAIRGNGVKKLGKVVFKGGTSTVSATLKAGRYVFYCLVAGHEKAGMKGALTVR